MKKGTKLYSIIHLKCPKCQEANLFSDPNPYHLKRVLDMPPYRPVCKQDFIMEPGFYSGALWISYPFVVLILVPLAAVQVISFKFSLLLAFFISLVVMLILQPLIMRYSRAIWINIFVKYDSDKMWLDDF